GHCLKFVLYFLCIARIASLAIFWLWLCFSRQSGHSRRRFAFRANLKNWSSELKNSGHWLFPDIDSRLSISSCLIRGTCSCRVTGCQSCGPRFLASIFL